jgi:hypothetical protein
VTTSTNAHDRAALIDGLLSLACFLESHPDVPVPPGYHETIVHVFPDGDTDDVRRAVVDTVAAMIGAKADDPAGVGHYLTKVEFGPVTYEVLAISDARRRLHQADTSYSGCIVPDDAPVAA